MRRVRAAVLAAGLLGSALYRVPPGYYSAPLAARARTLRCPVDRLCKTLVLENVALPPTATPRPGDPLGRQRFIAVLLQYTTRLWTCPRWSARCARRTAAHPPAT